MAIESEVVVVGGGLAGMTAALAAAREGADVRLISHKESTLRSASGLVDILGYVDGDGPLADPFAAIPELPADHPYRVVGEGAIRGGLALFDEVVGDRYAGGHAPRNALVPTFGGRVKPTARYPATVAPGLASKREETLLVGFETVPDFDAPLAASTLESAGVPFDVRGVTLSFPGALRADAKLTHLAGALAADEEHRVGGSISGTRAALAERVKPHLDGAERVGFPAILGRTDPEPVRQDLEAHLGAAVFEVPMGPPSMLGTRLDEAFEGALREAGVGLTTGKRVVDFDARRGRVERVLVASNGRRDPYAAEEFVLATGGLVGKGIRSNRERVREPVFDCHVPHPGDRYDWSAADAFGDHPFARFGVRTDAEMRPLDSRGEPEFGNLRAAGSVVGGYDLAAEHSGSGVSLATGLVAGSAAADRV